jgi:hypothetical protein
MDARRMGSYAIEVICSENMIFEFFRHSHGQGINASSDRDMLDIMSILGSRLEEFRIPEIHKPLRGEYPLTEGSRKSLSKSIFLGLSRSGAATWTT